MLNTQVQYWLMMETNRHNLESERLTGQQIEVSKETNRINWFNAQENQRHNIVNEDISWGNLNETIRHNQNTEELGWSSLAETHRHNVVQESIGSQQAQASLLQADAAQRNASTNFLNYSVNKDSLSYLNKLRSAQTTTEQYKQHNLNMDTLTKGTNAQLKAEEVKQGWYNTAINAIGTAGQNIGSLLQGYGTLAKTKGVLK